MIKRKWWVRLSIVYPIILFLALIFIGALWINHNPLLGETWFDLVWLILIFIGFRLFDALKDQGIHRRSIRSLSMVHIFLWVATLGLMVTAFLI